MAEKILDTTKTTWDFSSFIESDVGAQIEKEKKILTEKIGVFVSKWKERTDYLEEPTVLKEALDDYENLCKNYGVGGNVGYYLHMASCIRQDDPVIKAQYNLFDEFSSKLGNEISFFDLNISKIPTDKQDFFLTFQNLSKYHSFLKRLFRSGKHALSEAEEKIMNLKDSTSYEKWISMVEEILSIEEREIFTGEKKEMKIFSEIMGLLGDSRKEVRDSATIAFNNILTKHCDVATAEINAIFQDKKTDDALRGFTKADEARILGEDVDFEFINSLLEAVTNRHDISQEYYKLKAQLLGLKTLKYNERAMTYGSLDKKYSYDESAKIVHESLNSLDFEFGSIAKKLIEGGNIDVYPAKGKMGGGFCSSGLLIHPSYILLNYTGEYGDIETLAHEIGHAINFEMMKKQHALNYDVPMGTAEVASNFSENIIFESLLEKTDDDEERLAMLMKRLDGDISAVMRQVACYTFERELHGEFRKRGFLSKEDIGKFFQKHMKAYMGDFVEQSPGAENWWIYWTHIRQYFYVYSYASSLLIANAMTSSIKEDPSFISKIKEFYSAGRASSPKELFKNMGIEINVRFWNQGLERIAKQLKEAQTLAKKLGKI